MTEPNWITKEECLNFHAKLLARFGGLNGIRDEGLLDSAVNKSLQLFHYGKPNFFDLAAAYADGIVNNHPFLDGNKRSGLMAAALFLETNGLIFQSSEEHAALQTLALAAGTIDAKDFALWLENSCVKRDS